VVAIKRKCVNAEVYIEDIGFRVIFILAIDTIGSGRLARLGLGYSYVNLGSLLAILLVCCLFHIFSIQNNCIYTMKHCMLGMLPKGLMEPYAP